MKQSQSTAQTLVESKVASIWALWSQHAKPSLRNMSNLSLAHSLEHPLLKNVYLTCYTILILAQHTQFSAE